MFKNKGGLFRSGWKIALVFTIIFGLVYLEGTLFDHFATLHAKSLKGMGTDMRGAYDAFYAQWQWLLLIIQEAVMIAVPVIAWKVISKRKLSDMGFGRLRSNKKPFGAGLVLGAASITAAFILILLSGNGYVALRTPQFTVGTVLHILAFIVAGFADEILTRGYLMSVLRQTKNMPLVIIISAVLFSLMHIGNNAFGVLPFINITLAGMLFAYMYAKSGSIWMPIGYHIAWNCFQGNVYGFSVSGYNSQAFFRTQYASDTILSGGVFGPEGGLIVTMVIIIGFMFVKWYYRKSTFQYMDMDTPAALQALYQKVEHDNKQAYLKKNDSVGIKRFIY